jgi:hypothetical protein
MGLHQRLQRGPAHTALSVLAHTHLSRGVQELGVPTRHVTASMCDVRDITFFCVVSYKLRLSNVFFFFFSNFDFLHMGLCKHRECND